MSIIVSVLNDRRERRTERFGSPEDAMAFIRARYDEGHVVIGACTRACLRDGGWTGFVHMAPRSWIAEFTALGFGNMYYNDGVREAARMDFTVTCGNAQKTFSSIVRARAWGQEMVAVYERDAEIRIPQPDGTSEFYDLVRIGDGEWSTEYDVLRRMADTGCTREDAEAYLGDEIADLTIARSERVLDEMLRAEE